MLFKIVYKNEIHVMTTKEIVKFEEFDSFIKSVFKRLPCKYNLIYKDNDDDMICLSNNADMKALEETGLKKVKIEIEDCENENFSDQTHEIEIDESFKIEIPFIAETKLPAVEIRESCLSNEEHFCDFKNLDDSIQKVISKMLPEIVLQVKQELEQNKKELESIFEQANQTKIIPEIHNDHDTVHIGVSCDNCMASPITGIRYKCAICPDFDFCENCEKSCPHDHPFLKIRNIKHTPIKIIAVIYDQEDSLECNGERMSGPRIQEGLELLDEMFEKKKCGKDRFEHCREGWKKIAKGLKKKVEENRSEKLETSEEENESKERSDRNQPIITENAEIIENIEEEQKEQEIICEKVLELTTDVQELVYGQAAGYIADMLEIEYGQAYRFVVNYPGLTKEEILMKYIGN